MTKNEEYVLDRIILVPEIRNFFEKGEYQIKNPYYRPGEPLSAKDQMKQSIAASNFGLTEGIRNTLGNVTAGANLVVGGSSLIAVGARNCPPVATGFGIIAAGAGLFAAMTGAGIWLDEKSQVEVAAMRELLKDAHEKARGIYTRIDDFSQLKKIEQTIESMLTRLSNWKKDVEYERRYEEGYEVIQRVARLEGKLSHSNPELFNMAKAMKQPDYELLNSAKGVSKKEMEKSLIMLGGSQLAVRCLIAEREKIFWAQPDRCYTGPVSNVEGEIITQQAQCGYTGNDIATVKYHRDAILNIEELKGKEGEVFTIYCDTKGKAKAEWIPLSRKIDNYHGIG